VETIFLQKKRNLKIKTAFLEIQLGDHQEDAPKLLPPPSPPSSIIIELDSKAEETAPKMNFSISDPVKPVSYTISLHENLRGPTKIDWTEPSLMCNQNKALEHHGFQFPPSVLKSLLQKNVRMCRAWPAVRTALALMKLDFTHFIRRFSIIIIEDAILHPSLPFVIWVMGASAAPNFVLTEYHVNTLLGLVYQVASVMWKDPYIHNDASAKLCPSFDVIDATLSEPEAVLLKSLWTRSAFGGMKGDVQMLKTFCSLWYTRFQSKEIPEYLQMETKKEEASPWFCFLQEIYAKVDMPCIDYRMVEALHPNDVILSAIDFHCSSMIDTLMVNAQFKEMLRTGLHEKVGDSVDITRKLQNMIWWFRSSTNLRHQVMEIGPDPEKDEKENLFPLWLQLKPFIDEYSLHYSKSRWKKISLISSSPLTFDKKSFTKSSSNFCE
jgi:hypothetical protein